MHNSPFLQSLLLSLKGLYITIKISLLVYIFMPIVIKVIIPYVIIIDITMVQRNPQHKGHPMKRGHVTGHKKERKGSQDWYKAIEERISDASKRSGPRNRPAAYLRELYGHGRLIVAGHRRGVRPPQHPRNHGIVSIPLFLRTSG
jgi:hypothetical protein